MPLEWHKSNGPTTFLTNDDYPYQRDVKRLRARWRIAEAGAFVLVGLASAQTVGAQDHTPADTAFLQGMIAHHAQALEMVALMPGRTTTPAILLLGERMAVSQRDEIALMSQWLQDRGMSAPHVATGIPGHASSMMTMMPGMLSPAQMDSLRSATGDSFNQRFLQLMTQHHEGALDMVKGLLATPGTAREPQLFSFVSDVDTDQRAEIRRMQQLLRVP